MISASISRAYSQSTITDCMLTGMRFKKQEKPSSGVDPAIETASFTLTERQRQVTELRSAGLTYAAIGRQLGISGERVRQIEMRLLRRIRVN